MPFPNLQFVIFGFCKILALFIFARSVKLMCKIIVILMLVQVDPISALDVAPPHDDGTFILTLLDDVFITKVYPFLCKSIEKEDKKFLGVLCGTLEACVQGVESLGIY